ncbi:hypothetical protein BJV78DRAFT_1247477 [Lactifluus subvellereus]|nr:hypothetical protein BJV78DRAFT_1247477 [Lactifluus subvellereus]
MDALPTCSLSQNIPCTSVYPYHVARQGMLSYTRNLLVRINLLMSLLMPMIHSMLTLAMQSDAFLHLVVMLTALVARLAHLSSSLRRVLSTVHAECLHLLNKLYRLSTT